MADRSSKKRQAPAEIAGMPVGQVVRLGDGHFESRDGRQRLTMIGGLTVMTAVSFMAPNTVAVFQVGAADLALAHREKKGAYKHPPVEWALMPGTDGEACFESEFEVFGGLVECLEILAID